ncbi:MAG: response regulator [Planctomycetota bacterium]
MPKNEKVLLVDDDPNVLQAYQRRLRRRFTVETALCSEEGVTAVDILGPFAVVVSDMQMPRENGADFLQRILQRAPESVRIMLTGNADQQTAVDAVNVGRVFRFLNKPCPAEELEAAIRAGIDEHHRLQAERKLVSKTLDGVVGLLTKVLALASPEAFGRGERLKQLATELATAAELDDAWELELAASLSQLGAVNATALLPAAGASSPAARTTASSPNPYRVASELIAEAPRLGGVARLVATLTPDWNPTGDNSPRFATEAELLRLAIGFEERVSAGDSAPAAAEALGAIPGEYSADAVSALHKVVATRDRRRLVDATIEQLEDGMELAADVATADGALLIAKGQEVTASLRLRLSNYDESHGVAQPLRVLAPLEAAERIDAASPALAAV